MYMLCFRQYGLSGTAYSLFRTVQPVLKAQQFFFSYSKPW